MTKNNKRFYITTPIYYPSANLHIGHAYTTTIADALARYKKMSGYETYFLTGSDEHGQKIEEKAKLAGVTPIEFINPLVKSFKDLWANLGIEYNKFIRTTDNDHVKTVQDIFENLKVKDQIYLGQYESKYCVSCEEFWTKTEIVEDSTCPRCARKLDIVNEETYFLRITKYQKWLKQYFFDHPHFVLPKERELELFANFLEEGLVDLSVSRNTFTWGVPVKHNESHVVYVWIDALSNYISALGYGHNNNRELFEKFWEDPNTEIVHIVGKEITRFHCIYWPIMLHMLDLRQPTTILAHGWITTKEGKMSKSKGNVVDPNELIKMFGRDGLRFYLLKEFKVGEDATYSLDSIFDTYNSQLANNYGNFISRTIGMLNKYTQGHITQLTQHLSREEIEFLDMFRKTVEQYKIKMDSFAINEAIDIVMKLIDHANKFIEVNKPWEMFKQGSVDKLTNLLILMVQTARVYVSLLSPIIVDGSKEAIKQMQFSNAQLKIDDLLNMELIKNHQVGEAKPIFERKVKED